MKFDNMKYYNSSLAYDFERFMPKEQRDEQSGRKVIPMPRRKAKREQKKGILARAFARAGTVLFTLSLLGIVFGNIYLRAEITRVNAEVIEQTKALDEANNEQVRLTIELDNKTNYKNLEKRAQELGMQKCNTNQITYIQTVKSDKVVLSAVKDNLDELYGLLEDGKE